MPKLSDYDPALKYGADLDVTVDLADIRDANNNELLELDTVASAVNYIQIANAITLGAPALTAAGDDTNVNLQLSPKGTATVLLGDRSTGTIVSGSVTINAQRGVITTTALTAGSASTQNFDLINNKLLTTSIVIYQLDEWTGSAGRPYIAQGTVTTGRATFGIGNVPTANAGSAVLNGIVGVRFVVL